MREKNTYPTGEKMKEARVDADYGVSKIAELLNVSRQTYGYLESGKVSPRFELLQKFAQLTNKPMDYFYDETSFNMRHTQKLINTGRNQGIVFALRQLAELFDQVELAKQLSETIGISIDTGREKDAEKLKELINLSK